MFEKEADEFCENLDESKTKDFIKDAFKDGAEYGYNKGYRAAMTNANLIIKDNSDEYTRQRAMDFLKEDK